MKKLLAILLVTCSLLTCVTAFATEITPNSNQSANMTVTYGVDVSYHITVPESVPIGENWSGTATVTAENVVLPTGCTLDVTVTSNTAVERNFVLVDVNHKTNTIQYGIFDADTNDVYNGDIILQVSSGTASASSTLDFALTQTPTMAGNYTDQLSFTVSITRPAAMVEFSVNGTEYQAAPGMTWDAFVNSEYNVDNQFIAVDNGGQSQVFARVSGTTYDLISDNTSTNLRYQEIANTNYTLSNATTTLKSIPVYKSYESDNYKTYYFLDGWKWYNYISSSLNTDGFFDDGTEEGLVWENEMSSNYLWINEYGSINPAYISDIIDAEFQYFWQS